MEAAAAAATPTAVTCLDATTQEYVQEIPLESRTPLVHVGVGGEVGVVYKLNENDTDVHANMAKTLPKYIILQSNQTNLYLRLDTENPDVPNALRCVGDYSFGLETRFEVLPATTGTGLVHIRCVRNNKYLANFGGDIGWVTAMAAKPEENQSDPHCTLFRPVFVYSNNNRIIQLRHVGTGDFVNLFVGDGYYANCLSLRTYLEADTWTIIDWESIVVLPDLIRIKGDNGCDLRAWADGFMDYQVQADNSSIFDYEVTPSRNGGIHLKSAHFGTYWTDMEASPWVLLKQGPPDDTRNVFLPTIMGGDGRIVIRNLKTNKVCNRYTHDDKYSCLSTQFTYPDGWSYMEIEEPVVSRKIVNVRYHLDDSRLYDEKTIALISDDSSNRTPYPLTSELNLKTKVINTTNWSRNLSFKVGVESKVTLGVPLIASGELKISAEVTKSLDWGKAHQDEQEVGAVKTITMGPMSRVKGTLMATRLSYDIPFSYTQYDVLKDGSTRVYEMDDGLFTGYNGYGYKYDIGPLPLE